MKSDMIRETESRKLRKTGTRKRGDAESPKV
jgi:hypothetical protein